MNDDFLLEAQTGTLFPASDSLIPNPSTGNGGSSSNNDDAVIASPFFPTTNHDDAVTTTTPMVPLPPTASPMIRIPPYVPPTSFHNETGIHSTTTETSSHWDFNLITWLGFAAFCIICVILVIRCIWTCCVAARNRTLSRNHNQIAGAREAAELEKTKTFHHLGVQEGTNDLSHYPATYAATFAATTAAASEATLAAAMSPSIGADAGAAMSPSFVPFAPAMGADAGPC